MIRVVRLIRLVKLVKVLSTHSIIIDQSTVNRTIVKCLKLLSTLLFLGHLFGCFFLYITLDNYDLYGSDEISFDNRCMGYLNPSLSSSRSVSKGNGGGGGTPSPTPTGNVELSFVRTDAEPFGFSAWWVRMGIDGDDKWTLYLGAVYWTFTTITTVGYGDIVPVTDMERVYAMSIMILGSTVFGYIAGTVAGLASNPHGAAAKDSERMMTVTNYMEELGVKPAYQRLAKEQMTQIRKYKSAFAEDELLKCFPINLRREMLLASKQKIIEKVSRFFVVCVVNFAVKILTRSISFVSSCNKCLTNYPINVILSLCVFLV